MRVDEVGTQRFDIALELLRDGRSFTFDNVNFFLDDDATVRVGSYTPWRAGRAVALATT